MNAAVSSIPCIPEKKTKVYTLAEYLHMEGRSKDRHEYYNGKIIKMANSLFYHNLVATNTARAIGIEIKPLAKKYFVVGDGQKIYIEPENVILSPDALVICETPQFWDGKQFIITNPLLVVEVLSRSTAIFDRIAKFELYKLLPSFREYVLIDPKKVFVETRFREEEDLWRIKTEVVKENRVALRSLGVSIGLGDVYEHLGV